METVNIQIKKDRFGSTIHVLSVRKDWKNEDFEEAQKMFNDCQAYTERLSIPIWRLGKYSFAQLKKMRFV